MFANGIDDQRFNVRRGYAGDGSSGSFAPLQQGMRDIIAVANPLLVRVAWGHGIAAIIEEQASEHGGRWRSGEPALDRDLGKLRLNGIEQIAMQDGLVLALMSFSLKEVASVKVV